VAGLTLQRASLCAAQCPDLKARTHSLHLRTVCCLSRSRGVLCVGWTCQDTLVQLLLSARRHLGFFTNGQPLVPPRCPGGEECVRVNSAWDLQGELHEAVAARLLGNKTTALRQRPHSQRLVSPRSCSPSAWQHVHIVLILSSCSRPAHSGTDHLRSRAAALERNACGQCSWGPSSCTSGNVLRCASEQTLSLQRLR